MIETLTFTFLIKKSQLMLNTSINKPWCTLISLLLTNNCSATSYIIQCYTLVHLPATATGNCMRPLNIFIYEIKGE